MIKRGNLQDAINLNVVNGKHFREQDMVRLFKGTCEAVRAMHDYRTTSGHSSAQPQQPSSSSSHVEDHHADEENELFPHPEGDNDGGYSYNKSSVNVPLMTKHRVEGEGDTIFDGDEEESAIEAAQNGNVPQGKGEHVPYAHRDLKPG